MLSSISRKAATQIIFSTFEMFHFGLISMYDLGIKNEKVKDDFFQNAWKLDRATNTDDYIDTLHSLDAVGFKEYYKLVGVFAKKYKIANWKDYNDYEPIQIEQLNLELVKHEKTDEKLDLIDSFTVEELQSEEFIFASKVQVLYDILDDWLVFDDKEHGINKLLESFNSSDKSAFIIKMQSDRRLLDALINKVNGIQKDEMFALLGEIFISSEFITGNETTSLYNDKNDTINADFDGRKVNIDVLSTQHNGMRDYRNKLKQHLSVSPFEIIIMNYYGSQIRVPALLLLNSWSNGLAEPEGLFYNYRHEDIDWNKLSDTEKDEYFYEFVAHYLPSGFVEALGSPLQMVITGIITVGLAIATGGASAIAELEVVLAASGLALTGVSLYGSIRGIMAANDMKVSATTMHEAKKAAKVMAQNLAQLSLNVVDLIFTAKDLIKARIKNSAVVTDSIKMSPEEILREAGYKRQSLIDENVATIEKLQFEVPDEELIKILAKMKKKGLEKSIEHVNKIIDVIDNINVTNRSLVINNAESIRELKKYYTTQEITDILNNVEAENFEATIKKMTNIQKQLLSKQISSGETNKFAREILTELELKHGITEERLNVLRNLDYNKMTKEDYEKLKPEIEAIISLTRSYDLNKVKPGKMRKYIPVEDIEKYLSGKFGNRSYDGIRGFIARQDDALQLKTFDDIFYTMRLDYEGNTFIYNREIAYIDFVATSYNDTFIPIGELYGGTESWPSPFGGMGLLKTENGQLIREYVSRGTDLKFSNMDEAIMYKIDKNGKLELIATFNGKKWVRN